MAEKVLLKSDAEICGTATLLEPPPPPEEGLDGALLHAAATTAMLAAVATQATFLVSCCNETTRFVPGRDAAAIHWRRSASPAAAPVDLNSRSPIMNTVVNIPG
ncbi:MAG TPA: hypothetical protein VMU94_26695 [Streptosporangiaceae bacterium]|nr:hypothetical protein [Streptosporangiaceae bacterium]